MKPPSPDDARPEPTEIQYKTWRFIIRFVEKNGFQPSRSEIASHFGISLASVRDRLKGLADKGWIKMTGTERAIIMPDIFFRAETKFSRKK